MPIYDLLYKCDQCSDIHPIGVRLELTNGPQHRVGLIAYTAGGRIPQVISDFIGSPVLCSNTGESVAAEDMSRIFIQPYHRPPMQA